MILINDISIFYKFAQAGFFITVIMALYLSSFYSYLLFHTLVEIVTVSIAFMLFIISWNTYSYMRNNYLRILCTGFAFITLIDLTHTIAYKGINVKELLKKNIETVLDEQGWQYMDAISSSAHKMGQLIDDLLSFSQIGRQKMEFKKVDLENTIHDIIQELKPITAEKNIKWQINDLPVVRCGTGYGPENHPLPRRQGLG